jgi:structure-specific endonuclease subunit SLX1
MERLGNLHLLLRSSSFERWPLKVTFYAQDVFKMWERWVRQHVEHLRPGVEVRFDESATTKEATGGAQHVKVGIDALDVTYSSTKPHLDEAQNLLEGGDWLQCATCRKGVAASGAMTLVCPAEGCTALFHIDCLSAAFLETEGAQDAMLPTSGTCSGCGLELQWVDLVKELSLRMRGEKELKELSRKRRSKTASVDAVTGAESEVFSDEDSEDDKDWSKLPDDTDDEQSQQALASKPICRPTFKKAPALLPRPEPERIIDESDWDDAEVII